MNKTGTYIFDEQTRQVIKVSDDIPSIPKEVWFPKGGTKYFDKSLQKEFSSKTEKRDYLKAHGLFELQQNESKKHIIDRCAETINMDRVSKGQKTKTASELRGEI